ncbi:MAG: beta-agarase [bacterium]|nr:beta-agarase [bacterium]
MKMQHILCAALLTAGCAIAAFAAESEYNAYGGWTGVSAEATGFFHAEEIGGVWWIIDPVGNGFISKGMNHVVYSGDYSPELGYSPYERAVEKEYDGEREEWAEAAADRLRSWGFNTIGAWSEETMRRRRIPYTLILNIGSSAGGDWQKGEFPDVYSHRFEQMASHIALTECKPRKNDLFLIGYYPDNELRWGPDWRRKDSLLAEFLGRDEDSDGRAAAEAFLKERYAGLDDCNRAWGTNADSWAALAVESASRDATDARNRDENDFQRRTAEQYFRVCYEAVKKADPNHMLLGCRFAGYAPEPVLAAAGTYSDVVSYNSYNKIPPEDALRRVHEITRRPVMLTEFSFKAMDSQLPNTRGAGKPVQTQAERAEGFSDFVTKLMELPYTVGYHWFQYTDQPREGRFDGENSNFGVVSLNNQPWEVLTEAMTRINARVEAIHQQASVKQ